MHRFSSLFLAIATTTACAADTKGDGPAGTSAASLGDDSASASAGDDSGEGSASGDGGDDSGDGESSGDGGEDDGAGETGTDSGGFATMPDGGGTVNECDIWAQDCPEGEKCSPWADDGGSSWNALKCVPVDVSPDQPGDTCTAEGNGLTGVDSCDAGSMCAYVSAMTGMGICVPFCTGSPASPTCDTGFSCNITNDGVIVQCLQQCDPILQDCNGAQTTCLQSTGQEEFVCKLDVSGTTGAYADPCVYNNSCDPGLYCANATSVPGCAAAKCCNEFCDLSNGNPDSLCSGAGMTCKEYFETGNPPNLGHVGFCTTP